MAKKENNQSKADRNLQSIDYRKAYNQPILTVEGVFIRPFQTEDKRQGVSIVDVKTGKVLCLAGIGKTGKFYRITEIEAIQWTRENTKKEAETI